MPTLIRLLVILLVLAGLVYGAMVGLVMMVEPKDKEVTIRIPARELVPQQDREPLVRREIDTSRTAADGETATPATEDAPAEAVVPADAEPAPSADTAPVADGDDSSVVTLAPGTPE